MMAVETTCVVYYDLTREYLGGANSGTEINVSQNGNTVCPKREIQYTVLANIAFTLADLTVLTSNVH